MRRTYPALPAALLVLSFGPASLHAQPLLLESRARLPSGDVPEVIAAGDVEGDGLVDIVVANTGRGGGTEGNSVMVYRGRGANAFNRLGPFPTGVRPEGLVLAKLDGDFVLDVATANFGDSTVSVFLGALDGGLTPLARIPVPGGPRGIVSADFDLDTYPDLATANHTGNSVSILKGIGGGAFTLVNTYPTGAGTEMLAVARINADRFPDLITADNLANTLTPLVGGPGAIFTVRPAHGVGTFPRFVLPADLNGDGLDDAVVANTGSDAVSMERNTGTGFIHTNFLPREVSDLLLEEPVYLALSDVNGDGAQDVLASWAGSDMLTVHFRAPGPFIFSGVYPIQTGDMPVGILAADLNGDKGTDIAVTAAAEDKLDLFATYRGTPGIVLDNDEPGTVPQGPWSPSTTPFAFGKDSLFSKNGTRYVYTTAVPTGIHEVCLWWTVTLNRSPIVPVEVIHRGGSSTVLVNQREGLGAWRSIGAFEFDGTATVAITSPLDGESVSADAVRFRPAPAGARVSTARATVTLLEKARNRLAGGKLLAFRGAIGLEETTSTHEWVSASFSPAGEGEESADVGSWKLALDTNGNGRFDDSDREIASTTALESDVRVLTFTGFAQGLVPGARTHFFVVAEPPPPLTASLQAGGETGRGDRSSGPGKPALLSLLGAVLLAGLLGSRARRFRVLLPVAIMAGIISLPILLGSGCGSGGGGGGNPGPVPPPADPGRVENLRIDLLSIGVRERDTGLPASVQNVPIQGWSF